MRWVHYYENPKWNTYMTEWWVAIWSGWRILIGSAYFSQDPLSQKYIHGNLEGMYEIGSLS